MQIKLFSKINRKAVIAYSNKCCKFTKYCALGFMASSATCLGLYNFVHNNNNNDGIIIPKAIVLIFGVGIMLGSISILFSVIERISRREIILDRDKKNFKEYISVLIYDIIGTITFVIPFLIIYYIIKYIMN